MRPLSGRHAVGEFKITTLGRGGFASRVLRVVRHERRTSLTASPGYWHAYPVSVSAVLTLAPGSSPWRLQSAHGGTSAYVTDGDGRAGMPSPAPRPRRAAALGGRPGAADRATTPGGRHRRGLSQAQPRGVQHGPGVTRT